MFPPVLSGAQPPGTNCPPPQEIKPWKILADKKQLEATIGASSRERLLKGHTNSMRQEAPPGTQGRQPGEPQEVFK